MKQRFRSGGLAAWSIRRPISVLMLSLTVVVLGLFALEQLRIDLLPHIIYPEVRVRIIDPGVPARIMEDKITRQLEEQLAITEDAISVQSSTNEGQSNVDLSFPYGTDIDIALRDASTRLDRAKRFLPDTIDPPIIYKRDPSQIPVLEMAVSSTELDIVALRDWVDYSFSKWFINLPGVAAAEVGGGQAREIHIIVDQERLANFGFDLNDLAERLRQENIESPGGRLIIGTRELSTRAMGRFRTVEEIAQLPLWQAGNGGQSQIIRLRDIAQVIDTHEDERLRVRLNDQPGIKLSIQKQPQANTVAVVDAVYRQLDWLRENKLLPDTIRIASVDDQSVFIRHALSNAAWAAGSGALLAMLVVYLFLGNIKRTLIIGTAIPLSIVVTFILMSIGNLTLNIMTLGGIALGVGMLVDNTIVMLENITRHQHQGENPVDAGTHAAGEVNSAIVASTSTNLVAILPFLFIGGLVGLLFSELIYTLSAAMLASLLVAITVVPSLASRISAELRENRLQARISHVVAWLHQYHKRLLQILFKRPVLLYVGALAITLLSASYLTQGKTIFIPRIDQSAVVVNLQGEAGIQYDQMDVVVRRIEQLMQAQADVKTVFTTSGGFIFGRTEREASNRARLNVLLTPGTSSNDWIKRMNKEIRKLELVGQKVRMTMHSVRGLRFSRSDDDISIRIQGPEINTLTRLGNEVVDAIKDVPGLRNLTHTYEENREELGIEIDRERAASLGVTVEDIGASVRAALEGNIVSEFLDNDREYNIRLRLPRNQVNSPDDLGNILVGLQNGKPVRIRDIAQLKLNLSPSEIRRDQQRRIVEISASLDDDADLKSVFSAIEAKTAEIDASLPPGYTLYDGGTKESLQEGEQLGLILLALAIFLVFVVMAVQYESLLNPLVILLSVPIASIGVVLALLVTGSPISMPVWLGMIMLAGIVVNNAIVFVEQIEIQREKPDIPLNDAIIEAARLRLRPILMTTLSTVVGMLPLAIGLGEGSEMLQPLAIVIVGGLLFSMLVSLLIVPVVYRYLHHFRATARTA